MERPTSSSDSGTTYQVFLSFRGSDTRQGFADVLYHALTDAGIYVFRDNEEIRKGEEIGDEILTAIEKSRVFVPIFSKNYATSRWCLMELAKMFESMEASGGKKKIVPIFYDVSVRDVMLKTKLYTEALMERMNAGSFSPDKVREWEEALCRAGKKSGYELEKKGHAEFAKSFVREVSSMLKVKNTLVTDKLVQRDGQMEALTKLLDIESPGVRFVGIQGMGGIGKTTLAKVVFNQLCDRFDQCCFLAEVRQSSCQKGIHKLQEQLLKSAGLKPREEITHKDEGVRNLSRMLSDKKLLLVIDDIGDKDQIRYLAGDPSWFGSGSRIIITARDQSFFRKDVQILEAESMNPEEALRLFSKHAFDQDSPPNGYLSLSEEVVASTGRLPLALEVIGSLLHKEDKGYWVKKINELKKAPHEDVHKKLMVSYEALEDEAKAIFLDIACFFIGHDKTYPMYMWEACKIDAEAGLKQLIQMSLVKIIIVYDEELERKIKRESLWMHDQLRDMGRYIARKNRIWKDEEALDVLEAEEGNEDVEMLCFVGDSEQNIELKSPLPRLRYLELEETELELNVPLPKLTWFSLRHCSIGDFNGRKSCLRNVAVLDFSDSLMMEGWQGWIQNGVGASTKLKVLDLSYTTITELPDIIGKIKNLTVIDVSWTGIQSLPASIGMLKKLEELHAFLCPSLREIPTEIEGCTCLRVLDLTHTGVRQLPPELPASLTDLRVSDGIAEALGMMYSELNLETDPTLLDG